MSPRAKKVFNAMFSTLIIILLIVAYFTYDSLHIKYMDIAAKNGRTEAVRALADSLEFDPGWALSPRRGLKHADSQLLIEYYPETSGLPPIRITDTSTDTTIVLLNSDMWVVWRHYERRRIRSADLAIQDALARGEANRERRESEKRERENDTRPKRH